MSLPTCCNTRRVERKLMRLLQSEYLFVHAPMRSCELANWIYKSSAAGGLPQIETNFFPVLWKLNRVCELGEGVKWLLPKQEIIRIPSAKNVFFIER